MTLPRPVPGRHHVVHHVVGQTTTWTVFTNLITDSATAIDGSRRS
jgi:hypothetical protein